MALEGSGPKKGTVKWFNSTKGFGFITPDDGTDDLFVHQSAIHSQGFRSLAENEEVEYQVTEERGKKKAIEVTGPGGAFVKGDGRAGQMGMGGPGGAPGGAPQASPPRKWPPGLPPSEGKQIGTVKWFNSEKGFGFIEPQDGGADLFVHQSAIHARGFRSLMEGATTRRPPPAARRPPTHTLSTIASPPPRRAAPPPRRPRPGAPHRPRLRPPSSLPSFA